MTLPQELDATDVPSDRLVRIQRTGYFDPADLAWLCELYFTEGSAPGTRWDALRHAHMKLPEWFRPGLDPLGDDYRRQQHRLWQVVSGRDRAYDAVQDEKEAGWTDTDSIRQPGFFSHRDALAVDRASDHLLATGMLLKHSGLVPGDWALEYGAGFAQSALSLARLGVQVDTVDISAVFCEHVRRQGEFFQVKLTPFRGKFGLNPRPGTRYKLIWFYESFHHCFDFQPLLEAIDGHLADGGRIILGGEPIVEREYAAVPYPWGVRLHSEVAAVVRRQGWFELGFSEDFLFELFAAAGYLARRVDCEASLFGRLYILERRGSEIHLGQLWLPPELAEAWHPAQADGRWTRRSARLPLDIRNPAGIVEVELGNPSAWPRYVQLGMGARQRGVWVRPWQRVCVRVGAAAGARHLDFRCGPGRRGIFVRRLRYVP